MAFLFEEIRYEVCGVEVDRTKNVGITSTVKLLLSSSEHERKYLINAGWVTLADESCWQYSRVQVILRFVFR